MKEKKTKRKLNTRGKIVIGVLAILAVYFVIVFGRYVYQTIQNAFVDSEEFYFTSNILTNPSSEYEFSNWNGNGAYEFAIDLYNNENDFLSVDYDIPYTLTCEVRESDQSKITSSIATNGETSFDGVIYQTTNKVTHIIRVEPDTNLAIGDRVELTVKATAQSPYQKEISAKFTIEFGVSEIGYTIEDSDGSIVANMLINNTSEIYIVKVAFGSYQVGDVLTADEYLLLEEDEKQNCISKEVTISFDPSKARIDLSSESYLSCDTEKIQNQTINGVEYVSQITFPMEALSSQLIRFYKVNAQDDYTYPGVQKFINSVTVSQ